MQVNTGVHTGLLLFLDLYVYDCYYSLLEIQNEKINYCPTYLFNAAYLFIRRKFILHRTGYNINTIFFLLNRKDSMMKLCSIQEDKNHQLH